MATTVHLPHNGWRPRAYQKKLWRYLDRGGRFACAFWPRRHGKDDVALHHTCKAAVQRPATYWHMLPQAEQARKAIWDAVNPHTGMRRIDEAFPRELRRRTNSTTMTIEFITGSVWQVVGSDNYNSLVGSPPAGVVFSEWALSKPLSYGYLQPILMENNGWALFITTPRGRNHAADTYEQFKDDPDAFAEVLSSRDTGVFTPKQLDAELRRYVKLYGKELGESLFAQEYLSDFDAPVIGSYYARILNEAELAGRIVYGGARTGGALWDPRFPVETWWDLGISDATAIWFVQVVAGSFRLIDYHEDNGVGLEAYAKTLQERPYRYSRHVLPHDGEARELGTGLTRQETLRRFMPGETIVISPLQSVDDGINAVQQLLPQCWFDKDTTAEGLSGLRSYHREWDQDRRTFKRTPEHDWSSHCADAFRTGAMMWRAKFKPAAPVAKKRDRWSKGGRPSLGGWAAG